MNDQYVSTLVALTIVVAMLVSVVVFAVMRFLAAARGATRPIRGGGDTALLTTALQEAVTRMKAQEERMRERAQASERLSGEIVQSLTAGLLVVDRVGRVDILNPAGLRMLGATGDLVGRPYTEALEAVPPLVELIRDCLRFGVSVSRRPVRVIGPGGNLFLGVTVSPVGESGAVRGVICLFTDLTAVMELEEQLRLKEALARVGEFTAGLAHEFRNGLATIHGYSHLIDPREVPDRYRPYVEGIRQETEALGRIVTNFLRFARPETAQLAPVDLGALVRRVVGELQMEVSGGARFEVAGAFGDVLGDEVLLRQVLANLVRNAVEACEAAGVGPRVVIRGEIDERHGVCRVAVDDNGPGVPEGERDRIFQPFFTTRSRGTGLGLAIVLKIVVMHNGRVTVQDAPSGGASIVVALPLRTPAS